jgi:hypothetical protein
MKRKVSVKKVVQKSMAMITGGQRPNAHFIGIFISPHDESGYDLENHRRTQCRRIAGTTNYECQVTWAY